MGASAVGGIDRGTHEERAKAGDGATPDGKEKNNWPHGRRAKSRQVVVSNARGSINGHSLLHGRRCERTADRDQSQHDSVGYSRVVATCGFLQRICTGRFLPNAPLMALVPSLIEGLRVVQGLRVVPVFLYRYSMIN